MKTINFYVYALLALCSAVFFTGTVALLTKFGPTIGIFIKPMWTPIVFMGVYSATFWLLMFIVGAHRGELDG